MLVARRENEIGHTAVSSRPEFGDRLTTRVVDGRKVTGSFTEDLTLRELKTLRDENASSQTAIAAGRTPRR